MKNDEVKTAVSTKEPEDKSQDYGLLGLATIFIILVIYNFFKNLPIADLNAIFWGYLGMAYVFKYKNVKTTTNLVIAVCGLVASFASLANYILGTW